MEIGEGLALLGLSSKEAKVYCDLLEHGESSAGEITARVKFHRRTVYDALDGLTGKGLAAGVVKKGVQVFCTTSPDSLGALVKEKEMVLKELLPRLIKTHKKHAREPSIMVFQGKDGLKAIHEDILKENKDYLVYGGSVQAAEILGNYFKLWTKKRMRKKLPIKGIWIDAPEVRRKLCEMPLVDPKFIPKEYFSHVIWWVYANKLVLVLWRDEPIAVLIESADFVRTYRNFFKLIWRVARK